MVEMADGDSSGGSGVLDDPQKIGWFLGYLIIALLFIFVPILTNRNRRRWFFDKICFMSARRSRLRFGGMTEYEAEMAARRIDRAMNATTRAATTRTTAPQTNARQEEESEEDREKRFRIIRACLVDFTKTVDVCHFIKAGEFMNDLETGCCKLTDDTFHDDEILSEHKHLVIPGAGVNKYGMEVTTAMTTTNTPPNVEGDKDGVDEESGHPSIALTNSSKSLFQEQTIRNDCAVCIGHFEPGQNIIWSSNPICQHAFHEECILRWLTRVARNTKMACPCCRADFIAQEYWEEHSLMDKGGNNDVVNVTENNIDV
mmetsp:Transcript_23539/g.36302  ORF Transcript_23539/g.36302 Transcript_23539/m.36302 type:complete len:315 (-) Transcript_23539:157-1101(-)|eukprot:CAMPEP_0196816664 /NCGR_PEP_ID=MMETSP1362-20130617/56615_1 /TAXON_ID=163516 /ORGANISM="Leptocylindrus danicus, Strain CCMP1856" /LENGTH=314 /DNA_ID=CAMNT_0042194095 /DNA_START=51 /DNA_END=995 /DNA_ORIENTATION=+